MTASIIQELQQINELLEAKRTELHAATDLTTKLAISAEYDQLVAESNRIQLKYANWQQNELKRLESEVRGF